MANRYWIGNGGSWSDTAHWSTTSGGSGGASVPLTTDTAILDANSFTLDTQTITIPSTASVLSFNSSAVTHTPELDIGQGASITVSTSSNFSGVSFGGTGIYQSLLPAKVALSLSSSSLTLTTGGTQMPSIQVVNNGTSTLSLADDLAFLQNDPVSLIVVMFGGLTFTTAAHNITARNMVLSSIGASTLNVDNSTITVTGNLTIGAGFTISSQGTTWILGNGATSTIDGTSSVVSLLGTSSSDRLTITNNSGSVQTITGATLQNTVLDGTHGFRMVDVIDDGGNDWGGGGGGPGNPPRQYHVKVPPDHIALP